MPRCKNCKDKFEPTVFLQKFCKGNIDCLTAEGLFKLDKKKKADAKAWKVEKKILKEKLKTKSDYEKELQVVFNTFIRLRDKDRTCISCDRLLEGKYDAGHYYPVGSYKNIRYDEDNCHGQDVFCNQHKHGNLTEYSINLPLRIGEKRFKQLQERRLVERHYSIPELVEMKVNYKEKIRLLKK